MKVNGKVYRNVNNSRGFAHTKGDILFYVLVLIIPIAQICIFYFGVNFRNILMAFQRQDLTNFEQPYSWSTINFKLFANDIKDKTFWTMVGDSFLVWLCTQFAGTVLALFFSYYIYKRKTLYRVFKFVLFLPSIIPALLLVLIFSKFTSEAVPTFMHTEQDLLTDSKTYFWVVTAFSIWISFGSQVLVYSGAMNQIPGEVLEAGKLDGVTPFREFISLVVPYILPTVGTFLIAGVATIFTNQLNLFSFFGEGVPGMDKTIGYYLYILVAAPSASSIHYCYAAFLGLLSTLVAVPLTFAVRKLVSKWGGQR